MVKSISWSRFNLSSWLCSACCSGSHLCWTVSWMWMKRHETSIKLANNATNFEGLRESGHSFTRIFEFFAPSELQQEIYSPLIFVILDDPGWSCWIYDLHWSTASLCQACRQAHAEVRQSRLCCRRPIKQDHRHPLIQSSKVNPCPALAKSERTSESSIWSLLFASTNLMKICL